MKVWMSNYIDDFLWYAITHIWPNISVFISIAVEVMTCRCKWFENPLYHMDETLYPWASYQIGKIAGCACAGNAGNVSPHRRFQRKPLVSDPGMHHGTCVSHVPWCMSGSLTCGDGENVPGIPGACAPAILRIWQEVHGLKSKVVGWLLTKMHTQCSVTKLHSLLHFCQI